MGYPCVCGAALVHMFPEPDLCFQGQGAPSPEGFLSFVLGQCLAGVSGSFPISESSSGGQAAHPAHCSVRVGGLVLPRPPLAHVLPLSQCSSTPAFVDWHPECELHVGPHSPLPQAFLHSGELAQPLRAPLRIASVSAWMVIYGQLRPTKAVTEPSSFPPQLLILCACFNQNIRITFHSSLNLSVQWNTSADPNSDF